MRRVPELQVGVLAEFASPEAMLDAAQRLRAEGYRAVETFAPYDVAGADEALALPRPRLGRVAAAAAVLGAALAYLFYIRDTSLPAKLAAQHEPLYKFLLNKWYFDELYDRIFVTPALWLGRALWKGFDDWLVDQTITEGLGNRVKDVTSRVVKLQSGDPACLAQWRRFIDVSIAHSIQRALEPRPDLRSRDPPPLRRDAARPSPP